MSNLIEAGRLFYKASKRRISGWKQYKGNAENICESTVNDCWNTKKQYFQTSAGHFNQYYVRDFAFCITHLIKLGHKDKVKKTLLYAQSEFQKKGRITTQILPKFDIPLDSFAYATDSLPLWIHQFFISGNKKLLDKELVKKELQKYQKKVIAKDGFVRPDKYFGTMRDHYNPKSSVYSNVMLLLLKKYLDKLGIKHEITLTKQQFLKEFWNGKYFYYDRRKLSLVEGSSNVYPYYLGIVTEKKMLASSIKAMKKENLDKPFPLKYEIERRDKDVLFPLQFLVPNYEGNTLWQHLAISYMDILSKKERKEYLGTYKKVIEENKNFLEVFHPNGKPFKSGFYCTDESMLWSSAWLNYFRNG